MDPRRNPYAPGAGREPPELAGRDALLERASIALDRIRAGRAARSFVLWGLRGVGKTVLLNRIREEAEARGIVCVRVEAPEERSLPSVLVPAVRRALLKLDRVKAVRATGAQAMRALASFTKALKIKYGDVEATLDVEPLLGVADSGDLDIDLGDLFGEIGRAAKERDTAFAMFMDEMQYVPEKQLASLITALHEISQRQLPVTLVGAGLPQILGQMGRAKSYAERLFEFVRVDRLERDAAIQAIRVPAEEEGVAFDDDAVEEVIAQTLGYPYFLQEWGKHCWNVAEASPIGRRVVSDATIDALAELDESFFRVRFENLVPSERAYLRAMAALGAGPHRSGDIAASMGRTVASVAQTRKDLIDKGALYSPAHGDTAFTVPLFDGFMRRIMP